MRARQGEVWLLRELQVESSCLREEKQLASTLHCMASIKTVMVLQHLAVNSSQQGCAAEQVSAESLFCPLSPAED